MDSTANKKPAGHDSGILSRAATVLSGLPVPDLAGPVRAVGSGSVVVLPDVPELPADVLRRVKQIPEHKLHGGDWQDADRAQRIMLYNTALRHGLLEQHNGAGEQPPPTTKK